MTAKSTTKITKLAPHENYPPYGMRMLYEVYTHVIVLLYGQKFSRESLFTVFAVDW